MFKSTYKLSEDQKNTLKAHGLQDAHIIEMERLGKLLAKKNMIRTFLFTIAGFLVGYFVFGKMF